SWTKRNSNDYRAEEVSSAYDIHGNLVEEVQNNLIRTVYTYYPKQHPDGFVRELKDTTVYPSPLGEGEAPILRTRLTYTALPALSG
ncbi:hypothetical protein, partial [Pseudomonas umsongensis]|uniref:hypothetical protein n=1 Tax=Pseudomonas umsongensis TaxID=198618 RepID=UPI0015B8D2D9